MDSQEEIEAIGAGVASSNRATAFRPLLGAQKNGAHADYVCGRSPDRSPPCRKTRALRKPSWCEGAYYADAGLKKFRVGPAARVLIYGDVRRHRTAAVQLAKSCGGRGELPGRRTRHLDMVKSIRSRRAIDYTAEDFTKIGERFSTTSWTQLERQASSRCRKLLKPDGVFAATDVGPWCQNLLLLCGRRSPETTGSPFRCRRPGAVRVRGVSERPDAKRASFHAVIDPTFFFSARRHCDALPLCRDGRKLGIVVITRSRRPACYEESTMEEVDERSHQSKGISLSLPADRCEDQELGTAGRDAWQDRALIKQAVPDVVEELEWNGDSGVEHAGIICTGETYKDYVKTTFAKGAAWMIQRPLQLRPRRRHKARHRLPQGRQDQ